MGIESNTGGSPSPATPEQRQENQDRHTHFSSAELGTGGATAGKLDFLGIQNKLGLTRIDSTVEPYLTKVMELISDNLKGATLERMTRVSNSYAVKFPGPDGVLNFFGLQFASPGDVLSTNLYPASIRLRLLREELKERFAGNTVRLADARVLLAGYEPEMKKYYEMADTIVRTFQVTSVTELKNAEIMALVGNEFIADWRLAEARDVEDRMSPHGVRPRMDIGLTIKAKIKSDFGKEFREFDTEYRTLGVIGGYTEIREREEFTINNQRLMMYRPVFNITVCLATLPLEGVLAILVAALAPTIYNTMFWAKQWSDLSEGRPNPGMLEESQETRGRPIVLKDQEELLEFVRTYFAPPVIAFHFRDGGDAIPGAWRMAASSGEAKQHFISRLAQFFGVPDENASGAELSRIIDTSYDGAYGDPKGVLLDSRNIDYLEIAARSGIGAIDQNMRRLLLTGADNSAMMTDRAKLTQAFTNSFIPLWLRTSAMLNPDFIKWLIQKTEARRLMITDPNSQTESRSLGSYVDGFGSSANMGSIVTNGTPRGGFNLNSVWNF